MKVYIYTLKYNYIVVVKNMDISLIDESSDDDESGSRAPWTQAIISNIIKECSIDENKESIKCNFIDPLLDHIIIRARKLLIVIMCIFIILFILITLILIMIVKSSTSISDIKREL